MQAAWAILSVAKEHLISEAKYRSDDCQEIIELLDRAIALSSEYHKLKWSIVWIDSKASKKKVLKSDLNYLAYDVYSLALEIQSKLNKLKYSTVACKINHALLKLKEEHGDEINKRQLKLTLET